MTRRALELAVKKAETLVAATELKLKQVKESAVGAKDRAGKARAIFKVARKESKLAKGALRQIEKEAAKAVKSLKKLMAKLAKAGKKRAAAPSKGSESKKPVSVAEKRRAAGKRVELPTRSKRPRKTARRPAQPKPQPLVQTSHDAEARAVNGAKLSDQTYVPI